MKHILFSLFVILIFQIQLHSQARIVGIENNGKGPFRVKGKIVDDVTREPIIGANVYIASLQLGESADFEGRFTMKIPKGQHQLRVTSIGYEELNLLVDIRGRGNFTIRLKQNINQLEEIVVTATDPDANIRGAAGGVEKISVKSIEALPPFVGEVDVLKSITLLPGVNSAGEASSGFNVRGGGYDQNLILLGGAPLYNPSHLFGFFSAFNSDLINNVTLYKGGIPANYGGRASSILDLDYAKGDMQNWSGKASIGTISAKVSGGGPIIKDKLSILAGGRVSYANYLLGLVNDPNISNSAAQFYDGNAILNYNINDKSSIDYSIYNSGDGFNFASDTTFSWGNFNQALTWNHAFNSKSFLKTSLVSANYRFSIMNSEGEDNFNLNSRIRDNGANIDFKYIFKEGHELSAGVQSKYLRIDPGSITPRDESSSVNPFTVPTEQGLESGIYFQHDIEIGKWLGISYGARYVDFRYLGSKTTFLYDELFPLSPETAVEEVSHGSNEVIQQYGGIEPRVSLRFSFSENTSLKLGYNRMNQFIHLISNTATIAPTDIWKLSDQYIKPQTATQYSAGIFQNFSNNTIETSIEAYYKALDNVIEYKDGANLILNPQIETELLNGLGEAYGIEAYIKKKNKPLTGWISYTYSRSLRQVVGPYPEETINNGLVYPANYDKPHDLTAVLEYEINPFVKYSSIFTYSTGRPVTFPSAKFSFFGDDVAFYDSRNQQRILDYHRLDMSLTFNFDTRKKWLGGDWVLAVYNVYARRNAFSQFFDDLPGAPPQAYRLSVLGIAFPSLSYNVKF